jgi:uncharacterized membrane protein YdbT with pleckstrin-like domain
MFFTPSGEIETAMMAMTEWTGSLFLSLLIIVIIILVIGLAFPLPLEWTVIFIMPLLLTLMAYDGAFYSAGAVFLLYLAFILASMFLKR